jgi:hypothetical protein
MSVSSKSKVDTQLEDADYENESIFDGLEVKTDLGLWTWDIGLFYVRLTARILLGKIEACFLWCRGPQTVQSFRRTH